MRDRACFVIGSDPSQSDLNAQLYKTLMDRSEIPVFNREMNTWWDKPFVINDALRFFDKAIWVDNDVEIVSEEFFTIIDIEPVAACFDLPMTHAMQTLQYNTGVMVINLEHTRKWIDQLDNNKRSDQECFPTDGVGPLDMRYNHLRLMGTENFDNEPWAIHWTGDEGKAIYRERIKSWG